MPLNLNSSQLQQLHSLGITLEKNTLSESPQTTSNHIKTIIPLLSLSGLTLISFGGLILFKNKATSIATPVSNPQNQNFPSPTQVPKSIQHYLLTSQQYFSSALQFQTSSDNQKLVALINQSLITATDAIKEFPNDYRGYQQRGQIYQTLIASQPQFLPAAISDFVAALRLNPDSSELTRTLAVLYGKQGDAQSTLNYLIKTVSLEPTKAQNFYDLAKIQQQVGLLPEALATYNRLLTLVTDPSQKQTVESEKTAIEHLLSQSPPATSSSPFPSLSPQISPLAASPLLQADSGTGLIIAAPETSTNVTVNNLSTSNSLSGNGLLPAHTTQITIPNSHLTTTSQVYVTLISGGKNSSLRVLSKSKDSFTVGLDSPLTEDIHFKWWLVN